MRRVQNVPPVDSPEPAVLQGIPGVGGDGGNRTHALFPPSSSASRAYRDDRRRLAGLLVLALRDNVALALRRLADHIEVPDPYPPTQSHSVHRRQHGNAGP